MGASKHHTTQAEKRHAPHEGAHGAFMGAHGAICGFLSSFEGCSNAAYTVVVISTGT